MARVWPGSDVIGTDISDGSIAVATTCFKLPNLHFKAGVLKPGTIDGRFDLIVLMDVYEHIAVADRPALHAALESLLSDESRLILTVPTPAVLDYARRNAPSGLQPVDENIALPEIATLAAGTRTDLLLYRQVGIWEYGDYAHLVLGRFQSLAPVPREGSQSHRFRLAQRLRSLLWRPTTSACRRDYLGADQPAGDHALPQRFRVSARERHRLASLWTAAGRQG